MASIIETYADRNFGETNHFQELENSADRLVQQFSDMGLWAKMEQLGYREPAVRCAEIASDAASRFNDIARIAGLNPFVSPKVTYLTGLLYKAGHVIDDGLVKRFNLQEMDPHALGLYRYPSYVPERTVETSNNLKLALLLHKLDFPWFAEAILHGPHPQFFEGAELPNIFVALANANLAVDSQNIWHSYLHPAVNLFAIEPWAVRTDELASPDAKDWVDRSHAVAINTTLQHVLRMHTGIQFSDETYGHIADEGNQRWQVVQETFKRFGFKLPGEEDLIRQKSHLDILKRWMEQNRIIDRLKEKQAESGHLLFDHSLMVAELNKHIARSLNNLAIENGGSPILDEDYLYTLGLVHDCIKAFSEEELVPIKQLKKYEAEFIHTYPPEVAARGTVMLDTSHDAMLYAWLRHYEDTHTSGEERGFSYSLAHDLFSGPYHLFSLISVILSYSDLAVVTNKSGSNYRPDITERYLDTTLKYISDPHSAVIGYAKLMTIAASLSWYLGIRLPFKGMEITEENTSTLDPYIPRDKTEAEESLRKIAKVFKVFGIILPLPLRRLIGKNEIT